MFMITGPNIGFQIGGGRVIARRQPHLGAVPGVQVIRRLRPSHFGRNPAGLKGVGENIRPAACYGEGQEHVMQFGIGVCLLSLPRAVLPGKILQTCITPLVKAGTQVDEAPWAPDQIALGSGPLQVAAGEKVAFPAPGFCT
jgi:hypothetical protein